MNSDRFLVMGACVTPPNCCIVMELYPMNLASVIKKGGIPDDKIFHRIILGIAQGLNYLHMGNPQVIHRDLKPANILVCTNHSTDILPVA